MADDEAPPVTPAETGTGPEPHAATPEPGKTILDGDPGAPPPAAADWPEDWRQKLAGDDKKFLNVLSRYTSPNTFAAAYRSLRQKQDSGELKAPLPENATPEQVAAWRKDNGVPEAPSGYIESLPDGLVIGDDDKPFVEAFAERMHAQNVPPKVVHEALAWWNDHQEQTASQQAEKDAQVRTETEDALRAEWGADYRRNSTAIKNFLDGAPEDVREGLYGARLGDGTPLGNNGPILKWLASLAMEINPAMTVVPAGGGGLQGVEDRIAAIEKVMREDRATYNRDEKMQSELRDLYDARQKMADRAA